MICNQRPGKGGVEAEKYVYKLATPFRTEENYALKTLLFFTSQFSWFGDDCYLSVWLPVLRCALGYFPPSPLPPLFFSGWVEMGDVHLGKFAPRGKGGGEGGDGCGCRALGERGREFEGGMSR